VSGLESEDEKGSKGMKIEKFGKRIIVGALVAVLALAVVLAGCQQATPAPASRSADATGFTNVEIGGTLAVTGATTLTGNAALAGQVTFAAAPVVTVTANSTIATGNYTVVPLTAAGAVGTATITGCATAGKVTVLRNTANQTITITDTSTIMLGGNAALGQYDTLTLLGDGTNCLQISKADN